MQFEEGCVTVCARLDFGKDLISGGRTYTHVYHCQNSVELNTFYVGSSKKKTRAFAACQRPAPLPSTTMLHIQSVGLCW
jgi:hypothetical protein